MHHSSSTQVTKSDFLLFLDAPRHLWAKANGKINGIESEFTDHLIREGYTVEKLALDFFNTFFLPNHPGYKLLAQQTFSDDCFEARTDVLLHNSENSTYDLYEIKSATKPDKRDLYDVAFQVSILQTQISINRVYILNLNKEYIRQSALDLARLFIASDVTDSVTDLLPEISVFRNEAKKVITAVTPDTLGNCLAPKDCPCSIICHADLPDFSIFDIPNLRSEQKRLLLDNGIRLAKDIPSSFSLSAKQKKIVETFRTGAEIIDQQKLHSEIETLQYPLWFLDYETCISAIPQFDGYHPQQQMVFQYSLHRLDQPGGELTHFEHLSVAEGEPSRILLSNLAKDIGPTGTVIVWNKSFEMPMNNEMARLNPDYKPFLENINSRIYDMAEWINKGFYLHPSFKGSWSIKNILPVMVPELSYENLSIHKGDQASMAWRKITFENVGEPEKAQLIENLFRYCKLDTYAMVKIFEKFRMIAHL